MPQTPRPQFSCPGVALSTLLLAAVPMSAQRECWDGVVPAGALPEQPGPVFCSITAQGPDTAKLRNNRMRDTFQHGLSFADFEDTSFQLVGETSRGGYPGVYDEEVWRVCESGVDADTACRDHFRLELTPTSLTLSVNGKRYFQQTGIPPLPAELTSGEVYVYFASMIGRSNYDVVRFHWDGLAVNSRVPLPHSFDRSEAATALEHREARSVGRSPAASSGSRPSETRAPRLVRNPIHRLPRERENEAPR